MATDTAATLRDPKQELAEKLSGRIVDIRARRRPIDEEDLRSHAMQHGIRGRFFYNSDTFKHYIPLGRRAIERFVVRVVQSLIPNDQFMECYPGDELSLPVEKFMRDYYLHARVIHRVSRRLIARCRETLSRRATVQRRLRQEALADGLVVIDERLHLAQPDARAFREEPLRLLKVFWHSHQLGFELGIDVERAIEDSLDLIDDAFRASPAACALFLGICRNWGRVAQTLREEIL